MSLSLMTKTVMIDRAPMLEALSAVATVIKARSPKPILQNVLLTIDPEQGTELVATDLELAIRHRVLGVKADAPQRLILSPTKLREILSRATDGEVALAIDDDGHTTVKGQRWSFKLPTEDPDLYPVVASFDKEQYHEVAAADLRRLIRRTAFATDVESTRYALGGTLLEFREGTIALVGTDGRRLALQDSPAEPIGGGAKSESQPVIPVKALKLIERVVADDDPPVHLALAGTAILVRTERSVIYARLVEGRFPRYQDVFPGRHETTVGVSAGEMLNATEQALITTSDESRGIDFSFADGMARIRSTAADRGSSSVELPVVIEGKAVDITFDGRYLADPLRVLEPAEGVVLKLIDGKNAAVLETTDGYRVAIMPLTKER